MENTNQPPSMYKVMYDFSRYASEDLREAIRKKEIGISHRLRSSIMFKINRSGEEVRSITFNYLDYGKYVDMGVGRGMAIGSMKELGKKFFEKRNAKGQLLNLIRKPKTWYSSTIYRQNKKLADLLQEYYGLSATNIIKENLPNKIKINM